MSNWHRKHTRRRLDGKDTSRNHKPKRHAFSGFLTFVFYSVLSAIIFLLIYSFFFGGPSLSTGYEKIKEGVIGLKDNIADSVGDDSTTSNAALKTGRIRLVPSEMEEYDPWRDSHKSCVYLESLGEASRIYNMKQKVCREACGKRDMEYSSKSCEKDLLVCYCKE